MSESHPGACPELSGPGLTGQCQCGEVKYQCGPPLFAPTLCHCESCRRTSGAHALGWITVDANSLRYASVNPREFASSAGVIRTFCGTCGTPLTYQNAERPLEVDLTIGCVDQAGRLEPIDHIWMEDALPWDRPDAKPLTQHARARRGAP